ncbi:ATP-binding protein [Mucilaginibacter sp.]
MQPNQEIALLQAKLKQAEADLEETRCQLEEANEMIEAIRTGEIDALVVKASDGHQLYTLKNADQTYRIFIEQMTAGAVTLNHAGQILYSNSRFAELLGLPLEKVIGHTFVQFLSERCRADFVTLNSSAWQQRKKAESVLLTAAQQHTPVLLSLHTLDLDEGLSMSIIITDLSQQKQQQQLLEEKNAALEQAQRVAHELNTNLEQTVLDRTRELYYNQKRLSLILETMAEGVGITDAKGNLTYANPMAQRILGLTESEIKQRTFNDPLWQNLRVDGSPLPGHEHPMAITLATGKPVYDYEIGVQPPDKERFYISINAAPVRDEQGNIVAGIGTFMDVTHRRKAIQQKDEFISVASHELRTPITSLKASLQLLNRMKNNPSATMLPRLIDQSNKSLNKVSVLINDLLNATKLTEGHLTLKLAEHAVAQLVADCCDHVRTEGEYQMVTEGDASLNVLADADKIDQVLINLVNNAVKYASDSKTIRIRYEKEGPMAKISVTDYGQGIAPEKVPHLFERYYRVDTGGHQYSGLGLGLYICSEIVKRHGGSIGAESEPGKGSTFWFTLPLST